jgi:ferredoxin--NADP+ reductase
LKYAKVLQIQNLSLSTYILRIENKHGAFKAGQCFSIGTPSLGINREYSIYSGVNEPYLEFLIKEVQGGVVSPRLRNLAPGSEVTITGPFGSFCINEMEMIRKRYLFIASGTGIAPFHSFIRSFPELNYRILHGIRDSSDEFKGSIFEKGHYFPCISQPRENFKPERVTEVLQRIDLEDDEVFICGNKNMIADCIKILRAKKINGDRIQTETFF